MAESKRLPHVVTYDIRKPARLGRVFRYLKKNGMHIQYSVFLVELNRKELRQMTATIEAMTKPEDDIRIYPMPANPQWTTYGASLSIDGILLGGALGFSTSSDD